MTTFEDYLAQNGNLVYRTKGKSMEPMLRQHRDLVIISPPLERLRPLDVAFYRRNTKYFLHRVIKVKHDHYLIRGDNTYVLETVPTSAVIGVLTSFIRNGKQHDSADKGYRLYARFWNTIYPLRYLWNRFRWLLSKAAAKLHITPLIKRVIHRE